MKKKNKKKASLIKLKNFSPIYSGKKKIMKIKQKKKIKIKVIPMKVKKLKNSKIEKYL